jgi:YfiH family protein
MHRPAVILPKIFSNFSDVHAGMSTKLGSTNRNGFEMNLSYNVGDDPSVVLRNRETFLSQIGISAGKLAVPVQCHSNTVLQIDAPGEYLQCDALVTNAHGVALAVTIADCVPILLLDSIHKAIGVVHAGWKGTAHEIVKQTIDKMKEAYHTNSAELLAFIGPSAGVCCYEVGEEVAVIFKNKIVPYKNKKIFLDLKNENKIQLQQQGILEGNIEVSTYCTICENELFHSHRRDGKKSGRMMAAICII